VQIIKTHFVEGTSSNKRITNINYPHPKFNTIIKPLKKKGSWCWKSLNELCERKNDSNLRKRL